MIKKTISKAFNAKDVLDPVGDSTISFARTTDRYGKAGTISHNVGYLMVYRDANTGRFQKRTLWRKALRHIASHG
jgi:hypothetical protein